MRDKSKKLTVINTGVKTTAVSEAATGAGGIVSGGMSSVNMSAYLLKQIWEKAFEIKTTDSGEEYLFAKLNVATQYGITMYADGGLLDLPSIYDGLPIDMDTIYWEETTDDNGNTTKILKAKVGEGNGTFGEIEIQGEGNAVTKVEIVEGATEDEADKLVFYKEKTFIEKETLENDYLTKTYIEENYYTKTNIDEVFFKKDEVGGLFVTLDETTQEILGIKTFKNGLCVGASKVYQSQDDVVYIDANLVVRGGITTYGVNEVDSDTIMDGVVVDEKTISAEGGYLHFIGEIGGGISDVTSSGDGNAVTSLVLSSDGETVTYVKGKTFAEKTYVDETFVSNTYVDENFVTIGGDDVQEIKGAKNFTGGLQVNGKPIVYKDGYWKLEGDLLVTGGIASYSNDMAYDPISIMDGILTDGVTIQVNEETKQLEVIGGNGSETSSREGYVILKQGVPISEQMVGEDTIYEVRYEFDLEGETLEIPNGCTLNFTGGKFHNGSITLSDTNIIGDDGGVFSSVTLSGSINSDYIESRWFDIDTDGSVDCTSEMQNMANMAVSNVKPLNISQGTYLISSTITFQNGNWQFRGIKGNGNCTIKYPSLSNAPAFLIVNGSGREAKANIEGIIFVGSSTSIGIELRGACQVFVDMCYFQTNRYGVRYSNDVGSGTFTEGCITSRSRFYGACLTAIHYYRGAGDYSFHGTGIRDCWIDTQSGYNSIHIGTNCLPYNAPLDFRCIKSGTDAIILREAGTELYPNFFGAINIENSSGTVPLASGTVYFTGTINVLGRASNGGLILCERAEKRGPEFNNVAAFQPKTQRYTRTLSAGETMQLSSSFTHKLNFADNGTYMEIKCARPSYGGNPVLTSPIITNNSSWLQSYIGISYADAVVVLTNNYTSSLKVIVISTYDSPDNNAFYY